MLGFIQSECMPKHNMMGSTLGSILQHSPALGTLLQHCKPRPWTPQGASGARRKPWAVHMDGAVFSWCWPLPYTPGLGYLEEAAARGRCYPAAFPHLGAIPTPSHALLLTPSTNLGMKCARQSPGRQRQLLGEY